jgi:hypothetical protein
MKAFRWLSQFFTSLRQTTSRKNAIHILLAGIFLAFFLRNPTIALIFTGKTFDGRSPVLQVILFIFLVLFYTALIFTLYQLQYRFPWLKQIYLKANAVLIANPERKALFACLVIAVIYALIAVKLIPLDDKAFFGGDTWEYQSMGVNFVYGHGMQKFGGLEPFEKYQFNVQPSREYLIDRFYARAGQNDFLRPPAYPLFLGIVYRVFGVSPLIAKNIQLILLCVIAAFLPFIGFRYWDKAGFIGGIPAGILFLASNYALANDIMTEVLVGFSSLLVILALMRYERAPAMFSSVLVGAALGYSLQVKGNLYFLPVFTAAWLFTRYIKKHDRNEIMRLLVIALTATLVVLPWSVYASVESGKFVFISTQATNQLLDDNNERCTNGSWNPDWRDDATAFYNSPGVRDDSAFVKVSKFYLANPGLFPRCMTAKVINSFGALSSVRILFIFLLLGVLLQLINRVHKSAPLQAFIERTRISIPAPIWITIGNLLVITMIFHGRERYAAPLDFVFVLLLFVCVIRWGTALREIWLRKREHSIQPPG